MVFPFNENQKRINTPPTRNNKFMVKILKILQRNVYILLLFSIILLITSCAPLTQFTPTSKLIVSSTDSKNAQPKIELFVMSQCPYASEGENLLLKDIALIEELGISLCPTYLVNNKILLKGIDPLGFKRIYAELLEEMDNGGD